MNIESKEYRDAYRKTTIYAVRRVGKAMRRLRQEVFNALFIPEFTKWLERRICNKAMQWSRRKLCFFGFHKWAKVGEKRSQCRGCSFFKSHHIEIWLVRGGVILEPPRLKQKKKKQ